MLNLINLFFGVLFTSNFTTGEIIIDYDGDPMAYAPLKSALVGKEILENATEKNGKLSSNIIALRENGQPIINSEGYYISMTSLYYQTPYIQENNVNSNKIPYIALGSKQTRGAILGDYVFLKNNKNGLTVLSIYANFRGKNNNQNLEISEEAARQLGLEYDKKSVITDQSITATIYPGSRLAPFKKPHLPDLNAPYFQLK